MRINPTINNCISKSQFTYKGQHYSFGYFTDKEITDTYKYLKYSDSSWKNIAESDFISECSFFKYVFGDGADEIDRHLKEMEKLRNGLKAQEIELERKEAEISRIEQKQKQELEHEKQLEHKLAPHKKNIDENYFDLVELLKTNNVAELPNGILIESSDDSEAQNALYKWITNHQGVVIKELNLQNCDKNSIILTLRENLLEAKQTYNDKSINSLIILNNFENIGTKNIDNNKIIPILKNIFSDAYCNYKCTFLINIPKEKISQLDQILLVDRRFPIKIKL